jgi:hypothetical protein
MIEEPSYGAGTLSEAFRQNRCATSEVIASIDNLVEQRPSNALNFEPVK